MSDPGRPKERLDENQITEFREAFSFFDHDGNGTVGRQELADVMRSLGRSPTDGDIRDVIRDVDLDGNGELDFDEFLDLMATKMLGVDHDEDIKTAFKIFDKDDDGYISPHELRRVMINLGEKLTDEEINHMLDEADHDRDGFISYPEFSKIMHTNWGK